jgi:DNA-binding protein HU-beta
MNKAQLSEWVAKQTGLSKKAAYEAVDACFGGITHYVSQGEEVRLTGFGTFVPKPRRSSQRINPQTRERINVAAKVVPGFRPGSELKDQISRRLKLDERTMQIKRTR